MSEQIQTPQGQTAIESPWTPQQLMGLGRVWQPYTWATRGLFILMVVNLAISAISQQWVHAGVNGIMTFAAWQVWQATTLFQNTAVAGRWGDFSEALTSLTSYFRIATIVGAVSFVLTATLLIILVVVLIFGFMVAGSWG